MTFRVLSNFGPPYIKKLDLIPGTNGLYEMEGIFAEVFFELQVIYSKTNFIDEQSLTFFVICYVKKILNFTFELKRSPDGNWGSVQPDGTWNGMIRELQSKRADIGKTKLRNPPKILKQR